jgi:hypothetical protein
MHFPSWFLYSIFAPTILTGALKVIYFWIADSFLKAKHGHAAAHEPGEPGVEPGTSSLADRKEALLSPQEQLAGDAGEATGEGKSPADRPDDSDGTATLHAVAIV